VTVRRKKLCEPELRSIVTGRWEGEILGSAQANFGQERQPGPPPFSMEFTWMTIPAGLIAPGGARWLGVIIIMTPPRLKKEDGRAGMLLKNSELPSLMVSLVVGREQYSDMLRLLEAKRFKSFHFTVEEPDGKRWPIRSWGMATTPA
jgi:hypothetical protein